MERWEMYRGQRDQALARAEAAEREAQHWEAEARASRAIVTDAEAKLAAVRPVIESIARPGKINVLHAYFARNRALEALDILDGEEKCVCGEPDTPGVVHRTDGPCYLDGEGEKPPPPPPPAPPGVGIPETEGGS